MTPHRPSFNLRPLALLAAAFAAGVLCARLNTLPTAAFLAVGLILFAVAVLALARGELTRATVFVAASLAACGAVMARAEGAGVGADRVRRFFEEGRVRGGDPVELTGVLARAPETAPDGMSLTLAVERWSFRGEERGASGTVELLAPVFNERARAEYDALELRRGARLRVVAALRRDEGFRNPGVEPLTEYLERRDVDARGTVKSPLVVERLDDAPVFLPLLWLDDRRARLLTRFDELFTRETSGVLAASALGNRLRLTRATAERFREGGTFHVLVISGLHVTFVGGVAWWLARRVTRRRLWQWAASAACVWAYALSVGAGAPVSRAALMFTVCALAPALGRPSVTPNALGGAALALLAWSPRSLFDPSFQLTFLSVLSIVALAWPLLGKLREVGAWRPTAATPYPPDCPPPLRALAEALHWSERRWRREMSRAPYSYRLFKTPHAARLERWRVQAALRYAFSALVVSASVQLGMLPLFVVYFHRLSPASLVLNVFVGALMAVTSLAALAAVAAAQLGAWASAPFVHAAEWANYLMTRGVDPFAAAGVASVRLPEYTGACAAVYVLYYVPLAALACALARWSPLAPPRAGDDKGDGNSDGDSNRPNSDDDGDSHLGVRFVRAALSSWRASAVACAALALLIVFHPLSAHAPDGRLRVDFLDVGQGDAALVTMPDGTTLLVDGGGRPRHGPGRGDGAKADGAGDSSVDEGASDAASEGAAGGTAGSDEGGTFERDARGVGEAVVSEYLWWRGLDRVDYILATHADADHIDGLCDVARNFRVRGALAARTPPGDPEFASFADALGRAGVPLIVVGRGDRLRFGRVEVDVLWPPAAASPAAGAPSGNNDSVVLRVSLGKRVFLLTGDIEAQAEAALVALSPGALKSDAVKVAHHGSRTSSTDAFVAAARPTFAVVSVARVSPYGHPHESVTARWRGVGTEVLTTAARGMVSVSTDGDDLRVETYAK